MRRYRSVSALTPLSIATVALQFAAMNSAQADTPEGWISHNNPSAYVLAPGEFAVEGALMRVDDSIDFLNVRDDLSQVNSRLTKDSGDLDGNRLDLRVGVWRGLELFYQRQQYDLTVNVSVPARVNILEMDSKLDTERTEYGLNWVLYEERNRGASSPWRSLSLEISRSESESKDFGGYLDHVQLGTNTTVTFDPPQRFGLDRLKDEGWQARLIGSLPLTTNTTLSAWGSYGRIESSSGTSTEIDLQSIANAFYQSFDARETVLKAGFALNWQRIARLPVQVGYEYIRTNDRKVDAITSNSTLLPSFLRGGNLTDGARSNQTAYASVSWWFTPNVYASATGKVFRNQFAGIIPHYNNPLSSRFSDTSYGYAELRVGARFGLRR